jgi:hypothetical protein
VVLALQQVLAELAPVVESIITLRAEGGSAAVEEGVGQTTQVLAFNAPTGEGPDPGAPHVDVSTVAG